jgi:GNAT superfamily N-acetyltransferase
MVDEYRRDNFTISTDPARLDIDVIHAFLGQTYWATGIPRELVVTSLANSLCFGLYDDDEARQIGFARVITAYTLHAYLADVFVLPEYLGHGLGRWLVDTIITYPPLQNIRRMLLATADAQGLYARLGFQPLATPDLFMEKTYKQHWYKG